MGEKSVCIAMGITKEAVDKALSAISEIIETQKTKYKKVESTPVMVSEAPPLQKQELSKYPPGYGGRSSTKIVPISYTPPSSMSNSGSLESIHGKDNSDLIRMVSQVSCASTAVDSEPPSKKNGELTPKVDEWQTIKGGKIVPAEETVTKKKKKNRNKNKTLGVAVS